MSRCKVCRGLDNLKGVRSGSMQKKHACILICRSQRLVTLFDLGACVIVGSVWRIQFPVKVGTTETKRNNIVRLYLITHINTRRRDMATRDVMQIKRVQPPLAIHVQVLVNGWNNVSSCKPYPVPPFVQWWIFYVKSRKRPGNYR